MVDPRRLCPTAAGRRLARRAGPPSRGTLVALLAAALAAPGPATAAAGAPSITGGCRDGVPNGAFEARQPDGRLRIAGAFAGGRRSGTFVFWNADGARVAVIPYDDDAKTGTVAVWYEAGGDVAAPVRRLEAPYARDLPHGTRRSWHANGNPRTEVRFDRGVVVEAKAWAAAGAALSAEEASALARQDLADDAAYLAVLERALAAQRPQCTGGPDPSLGVRRLGGAP
jgi:hypothetical protein